MSEDLTRKAPRRSLPAMAGGVLLVLAMGVAIAAGGRWIGARHAGAPAPAVALDGGGGTSTGDRPVARAAARKIPDDARSALPRGRETGWQRVAPRAPLGPSDLAARPEKKEALAPALPPADPGEPQPALLFRPVATAAGRIEAGGHVIDLEGVEVLDAAAQCEGGDGQSWPCGAVARAAFRAWLRGRAVECTVTPAPQAEPVVSACRLGREDAARWLVANGFAAAQAGGAYEQAGAEAKAARRGIYGDRPRRIAVSVSAEDGLSTLAREAEAPAAAPAEAAPAGAFPPAPAPPAAP